MQNSAKSNRLSKSLFFASSRKVVQIGMLLLICFAWLNLEYIKGAYSSQLGAKYPVSFDIQSLHPEVTENTLRDDAPQLDWRCYDARPGEYAFGERECYADVSHVNQIPAYMVRFGFTKGRLVQAAFYFPAWRHGAVRKQMVEAYGGPQLRNRPGDSVPTALDGWPMVSGNAYLEQRPINPARWTLLMWLSEDQVT